jgi:hypothetical protein
VLLLLLRDAMDRVAGLDGPEGGWGSEGVVGWVQPGSRDMRSRVGWVWCWWMVSLGLCVLGCVFWGVCAGLRCEAVGGK